MISNIRLQNFRSYLDQSFEFEAGVNIVVGPNACGKTNLLEAVCQLANASAIRAKDADIIMFGKEWSRLDGYAGDGQRSVKITQKNDGGLQKEYTVNDKPFKRPSINVRLPVVVFEPNHLQLLHGSPEGRRDFMDHLLEYTVPDYSRTLRYYKQTLAQRNRLLKSGKKDKQHMFVWNVRLSELASRIVEARTGLVGDINLEISDIYSGVANTEHVVEFNYQTTCDPRNYPSSLLGLLEKNEELDYLRGFTAYGPHRDDLSIVINGQKSASVASRGETRTMLLALKLFELETIEKLTGQKPILLLDDVFSELDGTRRKALTSYLKTHQSIITTTDADILSHKLVDAANVIII